MITINNLPFPVSVNDMYAPKYKWKVGKGGKKYRTTYMSRSDVLEGFYERCYLFRNMNKSQFDLLSSKLIGAINNGSVLKVDIFLVVEHSRVYTKEGKVKQLDSDNFTKSCLDGLCKILGIDDKWIFSSSIEKVTCERKESECAIIKIQTTTPKSLKSLEL